MFLFTMLLKGRRNESGDELSEKDNLQQDVTEQDIIKKDVIKQSIVEQSAEQFILDQKDMIVPQHRGTKILRESLHMLFYLILVFFSSYMITHFVGQRTQVDGQSMENTLFNQDNLVVDKISYHFLDPKRYDIIVFTVEDSDYDYYIKRIIGMPDETVQIIDGEIYINDKLLEENFGKEKIASNNAGLAALPIHLDEDEYFVLGDNRNHSSDSRGLEVGTVSRTAIVGKTWIRVWPLNRFGFLKDQ